MRTVFLAAAVAAAVGLSGCGGEVPRGRIHGTITVGGNPLSSATVIFLARDNKTYPVKLKPDGSFEVSGVALGSVKVSVQQDLPAVASKGQRSLSSQAKGVVDEKAGKSAEPPAVKGQSDGPSRLSRYADADKSGLTFELSAADQEWSVDLK